MACIVVAGIAVHITDGMDSNDIRTVNVHQSGRLDDAIVTVTDVRAGTRVELGEDELYSSKGMIIAATVRLEAPGRKYTVGGLNSTTLHSGDRSYASFGPNATLSAEAGFATTGDVLFEVDPQHIEGAYIELYDAEFIYLVPQKLHVRLGITTRNAAKWVASAKGRTLTVDEAESEPLR
ncbi:MAG: hypothetical protein J2P17_20655 [Mycobacterium sp.]|nr:hypothetical protein [Mycobacterium sp.]